MATSKVIPLIPRTQAQPLPKPPQEITQSDLSYILATRLEIDRLKTNLAEAEKKREVSDWKPGQVSSMARSAHGSRNTSGAPSHGVKLPGGWPRGSTATDAALRTARTFCRTRSRPGL